MPDSKRRRRAQSLNGLDRGARFVPAISRGSTRMPKQPLPGRKAASQPRGRPPRILRQGTAGGADVQLRDARYREGNASLTEQSAAPRCWESIHRGIRRGPLKVPSGSPMY